MLERTAELHRAARSELDHAARFYDERLPGLGEEFLDEFLAAVRTIERDPGRFRVRQDGVRKCILKRFPFAIYFRTNKENIEVIAVAHGSRRPGYWKQRILDEQR